MNPAQSALAIAALISIGLGIIECFFGYRFFKFVLGVTGFVVCGFVAAAIVSGMSDEVAVAIVAGLIAGIVGAGLFVALYFAGVFLVGAFLGAVLSMLAFAAADAEPQVVVVAIAAVIAGVLAVWIQKFMIMLSTAFGGAWIMVQGVAYFVTSPQNWGGFLPSVAHAGVVLIAWLVLGVIGLVVQWNAERRKEGLAKGSG
jgi:hypothetical protein